MKQQQRVGNFLIGLGLIGEDFPTLLQDINGTVPTSNLA